MRRGWFGGTFDPIHVGHLDVARAARRALDLDEVVLLPARMPPHRATPHASPAHRFAMASIAVLHEPGLLVSDLELAADGPSFTMHTLDRLAAGGVDLRSLFVVTGADAFRDIASWKGYPAILDRCHFVAVSRPAGPAFALRAALPAFAGRMHDAPCAVPAEPGIFLVDAPTAPVSSTDVRRRIAVGASIDGLVPEAVARHIARHGLYRAAALEGPA